MKYPVSLRQTLVSKPLFHILNSELNLALIHSCYPMPHQGQLAVLKIVLPNTCLNSKSQHIWMKKRGVLARPRELLLRQFAVRLSVPFKVLTAEKGDSDSTVTSKK